MTRLRCAPFIWPTAACIVLISLATGCAGAGPEEVPGATTVADAAASAPSQNDARFAEALAGPIADWRSSYLTSSMSFSVPGTVLAASIGEAPASVVASGDAELGTRPMETGDSFHIGSMTKLFTAALIMQLDEEGILSLDDPLDTWFSDAPNGSEITVRMLLQHESGLDELDFDLVGVITPQQLIDNVFEQAPIAAPGTSYQYLNAGYIVLGRIAEEVSGRRYQDLVQSRLIEPVGLTSTYLDGYGSGPAAVDGYDLDCAGGASGGDCLGKPSAPGLTSPIPSLQWTGAWSAGGMVSTARDQAVWIRALVSGDVVDERHREMMAELTPLSSSYYSDAYAAAKVPAVQLGEGTGLTSWEVPGVATCLGHAGSIPGSNGVAAYCPDAALSIVILNNIDPAGLTPGYPGLTALAPKALAALRG